MMKRPTLTLIFSFSFPIQKANHWNSKEYMRYVSNNSMVKFNKHDILVDKRGVHAISNME